MHEDTVSPSVYRFQPHWELLPAGARLWRMHSSRYAPEQFRPFSPEDRVPGRFHATPEDPYACLYAATAPETALAETLLRSVVFDQETSTRLIPWASVRGRSLSGIRTRCELKLVSLLSGEALAAVCQDNQLLESEGAKHYALTRSWAREIRAQAPDAMGMIWYSKRNPATRVLVLFEDRVSPGRDDGALEPFSYGSIPDLGSPEGVSAVNQVLAPLRSAVCSPPRSAVRSVVRSAVREGGAH